MICLFVYLFVCTAVGFHRPSLRHSAEGRTAAKRDVSGFGGERRQRQRGGRGETSYSASLCVLSHDGTPLPALSQ